MKKNIIKLVLILASLIIGIVLDVSFVKILVALNREEFLAINLRFLIMALSISTLLLLLLVLEIRSLVELKRREDSCVQRKKKKMLQKQQRKQAKIAELEKQLAELKKDGN